MLGCRVCLTHGAPADEVVSVWILHQGPQLGEEGGDVAGVAAVYAHGTWRLLHADTCPLPRPFTRGSLSVCMCP